MWSLAYVIYQGEAFSILFCSANVYYGLEWGKPLCIKSWVESLQSEFGTAWLESELSLM